MSRFPLLFGPLALALLCSPAVGEVTCAEIFGDHMVLQAGVRCPVFGTTEPGERVIVSPVLVERGPGEADFTFAGQQGATATADDDGRWQTEVGPFDAGAELILIVTDADAPPEQQQTAMLGSLLKPEPDTPDKKVFTDVLAGEVWLCSGQSNMQWELRNTLDGDREIKAAKDESIRLFTVPRNTSREPRYGTFGEDNREEPASAKWVKLDPKAAASFSAVAYHFGTDLHEALDAPVGLIDSSWGGTPSEAWTREATLAELETGEPLLARWAKLIAAHGAGRDSTDPDARWAGKMGPDHHHRPGNLNRAMIAPLVPYAIRGAIWYQGESNAGRAAQYDEIFPAMIEDWRDQFGQPIPFFWVQLANFNAYDEDPNAYTNWAELREAQDRTLDELEDVGQAVILDIGEANDIHPRNKEDVGQRLALAALKTVYGRDEPGMLSPRFESVSLDGNAATVTFDVDGDTLQNRRDEYETGGPDDVLGFAVAAADGQFHRAQAEITGPDTVTVTAPPEVPRIAAVRYAWAQNPRVTLFNTRGLPAAPFRTDDRPRVTERKY